MITRLRSLWATALLLSSIGLFTLNVFSSAGDMVFQVKLIWGTDGEKPKNEVLKDVDAKLQERLKKIFKWKDYYEVTHKPLSLPKGNSQKLKLSDKCDIEVQDLGNSRIEIRLYGEGKLVLKKVQTVTPDEAILLGGDSKNETAWMVLLTPEK